MAAASSAISTPQLLVSLTTRELPVLGATRCTWLKTVTRPPNENDCHSHHSPYRPDLSPSGAQTSAGPRGGNGGH